MCLRHEVDTAQCALNLTELTWSILARRGTWARLAKNEHYDTVDRCLRLIDANRGQTNVAKLAPHLGVSNRQLSRRFQHVVGLSPKKYARVSRFLHVLGLLSDSSPHTSTETAMACGHFDQAHLNHEFREMAGMAPRRVFQLSQRRLLTMADFYKHRLSIRGYHCSQQGIGPKGRAIQSGGLYVRSKVRIQPATPCHSCSHSRFGVRNANCCYWSAVCAEQAT